MVVKTVAGKIAAKAVVITVSTRIIQDNVIKFSPELPDWKREAYDAMRLGNANKVAFKIDCNLLADQHMTAWVRATSAQGIWFQIRPFDRDMITGHFGGALGEAVEAEGEGAILAMGRQALVAMYGSAILKRSRLKRARAGGVNRGFVERTPERSPARHTCERTLRRRSTTACISRARRYRQTCTRPSTARTCPAFPRSRQRRRQSD